MTSEPLREVTVESIEDPDNVAPYIDVGYEFRVKRLDSLGATLITKEGSLVRVKLSDTRGVYLFGATDDDDDDVSPARVTFAEPLDEE